MAFWPISDKRTSLRILSFDNLGKIGQGLPTPQHWIIEWILFAHNRQKIETTAEVVFCIKTDFLYADTTWVEKSIDGRQLTDRHGQGSVDPVSLERSASSQSSSRYKNVARHRSFDAFRL